MTVRLYAERKGWAVDRVEVALTRRPDSGRIESIEVDLRLEGALDAEQRARLAEIAARCPVHRTLAAGVTITHRQPALETPGG